MASALYVPQVESRPIGTPYQRSSANPETYGAAIGQAIQHGAAEMSQAVAEEQHKARMADLADGEAQLQSAQNDVLDNPDAGFRTTQFGKNAAERSGDAIDSIASARDAIAGQFKDPAVKAEFMRRSVDNVLQSRRLIEGHVSRQNEVAYEASYEANRKSAIETIQKNVYDDETFTDQVSKFRIFAEQEAQRKGFVDSPGSPVGTEYVKGAVGDLVAARLTAMIDKGDGVNAAQVFAKNRDLLGILAPKFEKDILHTSRAAQVETQSAAILGAAKDPAYGWVDSAKAMAAVDALPNDETKGHIRDLVEHEITKSDQRKKQAGEDHLNQAQIVLAKTGSLTSPDMRPLRAWMLDDKNGAGGLWSKLEREFRSENRSSRGLDASERRAQAEADKLAISDFKNMDPEDLVKVNVEAEYMGRASKLARNEMVRVQKATQGRIQKGELISEKDFHASVSAAAQEMFPAVKQKQKDLQAYMVDWRLKYLEGSKGREPTRKEADQALSDALLYGDEKGGSIWSGDQYRFQVKQGQPFKAFGAEDQKYAPNKAAAPVAPSAKRITRTVNGETKTWNGSAWVK